WAATPAPGCDTGGRAESRDMARAAHRSAQERGRRVHVRDVHQDARPEGDAVEGAAIAAQRSFRLRATHQVVPDTLCDPPTGLRDDLLVADEVDGQARPSYRAARFW